MHFLSSPYRRVGHAAALVGIACSLNASSAAADAGKRPSLDPDFPVRIEDAHPVDFGDAYVKFISRYTDAENGTDLTLLQPEVAWGFAENFDIHLSNAYLVGDGDRTGSGNLNLNVQWLFLDETQGEWWPAIAVEADAIFPTGVGSDGIDVTGQINISKTLVWAPTWDSVHLNLTYTHNFIPNADERDESYNVIVGYSRRVLDDTTFVADVVFEKTLTEHFFSETAEVGVIQEIGEHVSLAGGVGVGLGDDSPDFTATLGIIVSK